MAFISLNSSLCWVSLFKCLLVFSSAQVAPQKPSENILTRSPAIPSINRLLKFACRSSQTRRFGLIHARTHHPNSNHALPYGCRHHILLWRHLPFVSHALKALVCQFSSYWHAWLSILFAFSHQKLSRIFHVYHTFQVILPLRWWSFLGISFLMSLDSFYGHQRLSL